MGKHKGVGEIATERGRGGGRATNLSVVQSTHGTLAGLIKHKIATKRWRRRVKILKRKCRHYMIF